MLRTQVFILGPLVLVAMFAHPTMVSAQPISARVDMLQAQAEPREISNLLPLGIHTIERRQKSRAEQTAELRFTQMALRAVLAESRVVRAESRVVRTETSAIRNAIQTIVNGDLSLTESFIQSPDTFRFEEWDAKNNAVIQALQKLVSEGLVDYGPWLLGLRKTSLAQYIIHLLVDSKSESDGHLILTKGDIKGAKDRAEALLKSDAPQKEHWEGVLLYIHNLKEGTHDGQNRDILDHCLAFIKAPPSQAVVKSAPSGPSVPT